MFEWETISISRKSLKNVEILVRKGYYLCVSEFVSEAIQSLLETIWKERERLLYNRKHAWVADILGETKVGLSQYAAEHLKTIIALNTSEVGKTINQGEPLALLETTSKRFFVLYSPVSGKIKSVNERVLEEPYLINEDAYGVGWIITIKPLNFEMEKRHLLTCEDYDRWINFLRGQLLQR
jgi:glycine cleavage system H protein